MEVVLRAGVLQRGVVLQRMQDLNRSWVGEVSSDCNRYSASELVVLQYSSGIPVDPVNVILKNVD